MNWLLKSAETSETLSLIMDFPRAWRLALLFFVSGMGTWFAFRSSFGPTRPTPPRILDPRRGFVHKRHSIFAAHITCRMILSEKSATFCGADLRFGIMLGRPSTSHEEFLQ